MDIKDIVANNLVQLRKSQKLTQAELAEKVGYSDKSISKWERGDSYPDIEVLNKLSKLYGISLDFFVTENAIENKEDYVVKNDKANKICITLFWLSFVWLVVTILYVYVSINLKDVQIWTAFLWAVPASCIELGYFNKKWGNRKYSLIISSVLCWSLLICSYIQFIEYRVWLIFLIGIPVQSSIILWHKLK